MEHRLLAALLRHWIQSNKKTKKNAKADCIRQTVIAQINV